MHPSMTTSGKRWAMVIGIVGGLAMPKKVPCEVPGRRCEQRDELGRTCQVADLEPLGVYLVERVFHRDLPLAYRTWLDCP